MIFWTIFTATAFSFLHVDCALVPYDVLRGRAPVAKGLGAPASSSHSRPVRSAWTEVQLDRAVVRRGRKPQIYDGLVALGAAATPGLLQDIKLLLTAVFTALIVWIVDLAVPVTASYIICAVIAALAGAMENWLFKQTARLERWLLIAAGLALVYPKWLFDYVGVALPAVVAVSQMLRKTVGRPLAD